MNILDQIIEHKRGEVADRREQVPIKHLEQMPFFARTTLSLKAAVGHSSSSGVIAEFKRKSPSKGLINGNALPQEVTRAYVQAGASALSVLTDQKFFGGNSSDLSVAREINACPILRKDFTVDEYHILEAKAIGADAILLIAAVLAPLVSKRFAALAHSLGLEVLLEVHNEEELRDNLAVGADLIGVNNRNLKDFAVSTEVSKKLAAFIPDEIIKVSESGLSSPATIEDLRSFGYKGFLIGERFMKQADPGKAAAEFIGSLGAFKTGRPG